MNRDMKMFGYTISFILIATIIGLMIGNFFQISTANIAIIEIQGEIGPSTLSFTGISSDDFDALLGSAENNPNVRAIILSINSPGGSVVSSQEMANSVKNCSKPIVAWIRDSGASGAYWVASSADKIVASPLSLTGSIGVTATDLEYSGLFEQYGITYVNLYYPSEKDMLTNYREICDEE